jgi:hypothetical protein
MACSTNVGPYYEIYTYLVSYLRTTALLLIFPKFALLSISFYQSRGEANAAPDPNPLPDPLLWL